MATLTLNAAVAHLDAIAKLAVIENSFLSCVHTYLRNVETDILPLVRADCFKSHNDIAVLLDKQKRVELLVDKFLRGDL